MTETKWRRKTIEGLAEAVASEYIERDLLPGRIIDDVTGYLENDEPLEALEVILETRQGYTRREP
ncbi:hypothetical protein [Natrinema halophilum]|uniref:Uncharacterized protein n=1 Tax=Natrinema halophilum TaxID=1699371 RepID=A0A7D5KES5_9EURY|nr:hypothetical protein [Natrinema halophilum]QLG50321.1 hypothetical protein HYG82_16465 [Natrinema halophilum]